MDDTYSEAWTDIVTFAETYTVLNQLQASLQVENEANLQVENVVYCVKW